MADNYNISTTQQQANEAEGLDSNNPAMTYVDFANQMAANSQAQALQAQRVQQAQELTKQQKLSTTQGAAAADLGVNPNLKGYLSVQEAVAQLKAAGVDDDQIQAFVSSLGDQQMVSQAAIDTVIRKKELSVKTTIAGKKFTTDQDILIPSGSNAADMGLVADPAKPGVGHVPADGEYQVAIDPGSGQPISFIPLGESPEDHQGAKDAAATEKAWQKLDTEMNKFIRSSRGNALTQAAQRAVRALNELSEGQPLTPQMLSYIQKDISGIFQGGVPPVAGQDSEDFSNVLQRVNGLIAKYTGVQGYLHHDLGNQREYLLGLLMRLRASTTDMLKQALASEASGYQTIIDAAPDRWQAMIDGKLKAVEAGLSQNTETTMKALNASPAGSNPPALGVTPAAPTTPTNASAAQTGQPNIDALASALGLKKKAAQ